MFAKNFVKLSVVNLMLASSLMAGGEWMESDSAPENCMRRSSFSVLENKLINDFMFCVQQQSRPKTERAIKKRDDYHEKITKIIREAVAKWNHLQSDLTSCDLNHLQSDLTSCDLPWVNILLNVSSFLSPFKSCNKWKTHFKNALNNNNYVRSSNPNYLSKKVIKAIINGLNIMERKDLDLEENTPLFFLILGYLSNEDNELNEWSKDIEKQMIGNESRPHEGQSMATKKAKVEQSEQIEPCRQNHQGFYMWNNRHMNVPVPPQPILFTRNPFQRQTGSNSNHQGFYMWNNRHMNVPVPPQPILFTRNPLIPETGR